jgi:hypothetical protein
MSWRQQSGTKENTVQKDPEGSSRVQRYFSPRSTTIRVHTFIMLPTSLANLACRDLCLYFGRLWNSRQCVRQDESSINQVVTLCWKSYMYLHTHFFIPNHAPWPQFLGCPPQREVTLLQPSSSRTLQRRFLRRDTARDHPPSMVEKVARMIETWT